MEFRRAEDDADGAGQRGGIVWGKISAERPGVLQPGEVVGAVHVAGGLIVGGGVEFVFQAGISRHRQEQRGGFGGVALGEQQRHVGRQGFFDGLRLAVAVEGEQVEVRAVDLAGGQVQAA